MNIFKSWTYKLSLKDIMKPYEGRNVTNQEARIIGKAVAKKIREHRMFEYHKTLLEPICESFQRVKSQEGFNRTLDSLYNWGDYNKTCWIETYW